MSMNQLAQNPSQAWIWQPIAMDSQQQHHHHYYYQLQHHQAAEHEQRQEMSYGREHMFEKLLTPSDVGKLNRLVIPKQHAEKYFPLDSESGEKGLLLSFEDESGKSWKFRYSYWTSSQSYVLTKGWSRYVKDKKLDAGDVVLFERYRAAGTSSGSGDDRLCIGCRRRSSYETNTAAAAATTTQAAVQDVGAAVHSANAAALPWRPSFYPTSYSYMNNSVSSGDQGSSPVESSTGAAVATGNSKRLRLFGVNLEFGPDPAEPQHLEEASGQSRKGDMKPCTPNLTNQSNPFEASTPSDILIDS